MTILTPNRSSSENTHTGNLVRKFFLNPIQEASLLDLDKMLVRKISVILFTINCGFSINTEKYRKHCEETFDLYVELYPWFYMPQSVHCLLLHSVDTIDALSGLLIGETSKEGQESRNRDHLFAREHHS